MKKILENKNFLIVILGVLIGVLLIVFGSLKGSDKQENDVTSEQMYESEELESYTDALEEKLKAHIEKIGGVSNVSVLVTIDSLL